MTSNIQLRKYFNDSHSDNIKEDVEVITSEIQDVQLLHLHINDDHVVTRVRATVVIDYRGRFKQGDWVLTSAVVEVNKKEGVTDFITRSGSQYRTQDAEISTYHFSVTEALVFAMMSGVSGDTLAELFSDLVLKGN